MDGKALQIDVCLKEPNEGHVDEHATEYGFREFGEVQVTDGYPEMAFWLEKNIRVFRKLTKLAVMAILASEALQCEKIQWQNVTSSGNRTQAASDSKSNTILSTLTWHLLARLRL